jgi:ubiquinone/menaquinone biosynthesis C-methylase UbiE
MPIRTRKLKEKEILRAAKEVEKIYPRVVSIVFWRAWEVAAYRYFRLVEPALDLACGDGRFFQFSWPKIKDVVGIDHDPVACERARKLGVYREVHQVPAHQLPFSDNSFASLFSNCALEHMDHIDKVLAESHRVLKPGGLFVTSVVTDKFVEWGMMPLLSKLFHADEKGAALWQEYEDYHQLRNPFTQEEWVARMEKAGFDVLEQIPIAPEPSGRLFMLFDELWHLKLENDTEVSQPLHGYLSSLSNFSDGFEDIMRGLIKLSPNPTQGAGAVFVAQKPK